MCLVTDQVGGNISQKGDGLIGGELLLTEPGQVAQQTTLTKDKHYTLLGLTLLTGQHLVCVLIMVGDTPKIEVKTDIDICVEQVVVPTDRDYTKNDTGEGCRFLGGPTYMVQGVDVPCFIWWSTNGSMTSKIL